MVSADKRDFNCILGLTGKVTDVKIAHPADEIVKPLDSTQIPADIDIKRMAEWALNYLTETPRKELNYEPVFQCHPLKCPPVPEGQDPVVACDTDARMDWEWYYMREITGSTRGKEVEEAFHKRMKSFIEPDGRVLAHPGCFNENDIDIEYTKEDYVIHIWGATKILKSLSEDYARTGNIESKELARKVMLALKKLAIWDDNGRCWFTCGMGALRKDLSVVPNGWNRQPAPIVDPLVTYWLATNDPDGLEFAKAYTEGIIHGSQPGGMQFGDDGSFHAHSHATTHAIWGVASLGMATGESRYVDFAKRVFDNILSRGTGTGWFPAAMDSTCNETCHISDMITLATILGQSGYPEYFDYAERYFRNYISNIQFIVTPEFENYYRELHKDKDEESIAKGLEVLRKFQGGVIGGSGINDFENELLNYRSSFEMFGCCAPEGMRAIYTVWSNTIEQRKDGVYINLGLSRDSKWGHVVSFMPETGRLTVKSAVKSAFFIRPPHWAPKDEVRAFIGTKQIPVEWSGTYIRFDAEPGDELTITYLLIGFTHEVNRLWPTAPDLVMTFSWLGNMVIKALPEPTKTPLFTGKPRVLPEVSA